MLGTISRAIRFTDGLVVGGMVRGISKEVMARIEAALRADGFQSSAQGIFVKKWNELWSAWIGIDGSPYALSARIGTFSKELLDIRRAALKKIGRSRDRQPGGGPPLIMVSLERLIDQDAEYSRRISWQFKEDGAGDGVELNADNADDLIYCLRGKAYQFIDAHVGLDRILHATEAGMGSPALPFYLPIILLKMGRVNDADKFVKDWVKQLPAENSAVSYEQYFQALKCVLSLGSQL